ERALVGLLEFRVRASLGVELNRFLEAQPLRGQPSAVRGAGEFAALARHGAVESLDGRQRLDGEVGAEGDARARVEQLAPGVRAFLGAGTADARLGPAHVAR